jgi:23S rRNA pseudouridine2605 synthase
VVRSPHLLVDVDEINQSGSVVLKVQGKGVQLDLSLDNDVKGQSSKVPVVYAVHKLPGEVVSEKDPQNRPSMITRLVEGGVGMRRVGKKLQQMHLKPIGRLDIPTEGLCIVTNDGNFARQMELPKNQVHRVYRARVHGRLTSAKLNRIRKGGVRFNEVRYGPMQVSVEKSRSSKQRANTWVQITSIEGKNRQIRNVFEALGGAYEFG